MISRLVVPTFVRASRVAAALLLAGLANRGAGADDAAEGEVLFVRRVWPLLKERCLSCHGDDEAKIKGGLDLRTAAGAKTGGDSGAPAFVAGRPDDSPMLWAVTREEGDFEPMPPKEADRLDEEQIGWLRAWIAAGAPWPETARQKAISTARAERWSAEDGVTVRTSGGLSEDWTHRRYKPEGLWAYQPVRKPAVPAATPGTNPIDAFLAARRPAGLEVAAPAEPRVLIRRMSFDLTGLPPSPEEVTSFTRDYSQDPEHAVRTLADRLLESPHYGERMAQHWLDVVRYADTAGFANDYERGNAWRYRDYVVRSFNADKPYGRFVREQIAGDEIAPDDPEMLVATGFLRMGPWELTGMEVPKIARQRFLDDVTNAVGETFLAQSLQCARCHDHKFDPIPTRDYYSVQAVFATTQLAERAAPFLSQENTRGFDEKKYLEIRRVEYLATLQRLDAQMLQSAEAWLRERAIDPSRWRAAVAQATAQERGGRRREFEGAFAAARNLSARQGVAEDQYPPKFVGFTPQDYGDERVARKGLERLRWELERYEPFALSVYSGRTPTLKSVNAPLRVPANRRTEGEAEESCILTGGDPFASGAKVSPGVLTVLSGLSAPPIPTELEGRRRAFAEWVAAPENPLTARAIVNRIWLWHFGRPLAGNPNNFGSTGAKPTHPELLDWLAATFVEQGGSFKALHRLIVSSTAYRRSSVPPDPARSAQLDPTGASLAVFPLRRLSAEELRDAMLAATGELNRTVGGIPNRPEINLEAALQPRQVMGTFAAAWSPNPRPEDRHRRSLYALRIRGLPDPALEVFNQPGPDFSCERREASTVTPQVFSLFNSQSSHDRALALAARARRETGSDEAAVARCFELALARPPTTSERQACLDHWKAVERLIAADLPVARERPRTVRRDAVEENTGEKFSFLERLPAYDDFVPDLQPGDVPLPTRALADVCLALFNTNEFAYVD